MKVKGLKVKDRAWCSTRAV